jgi:quinol monooxygenase YgiN
MPARHRDEEGSGMYGTVARLRLKPGAEAALRALFEEYGTLALPGAIASYLYRMDADPQEYYLTVVWQSKAFYDANAISNAAQHARYLKLIELLDGMPEWHDGEIIHAIA